MSSRFIDAVLVARDFHNGNTQLIKKDPVSINPDVCEAVIERAKEYSAVDNLENLKILELDTDTTKVAALLIRRRSDKPINLLTDSPITPVILLSKNLSTCWKRFALCKELMRIYTADDSSGTPSIEGIIEQLESISGDFHELKDIKKLDIEHFTFVIAIEVMLPWSNRKRLHEMKREGRTHYQIGNEFKVPEAIVDLYFDSDYKRISSECNSSLDDSC